MIILNIHAGRMGKNTCGIHTIIIKTGRILGGRIETEDICLELQRGQEVLYKEGHKE